MLKKIVKASPFLLIVVLVVTALACGDGESSLSNEDLIEGIIGSSDEVESLTLEAKVQLSIDGSSEGETIDGEITLAADIAVDVPNEAMKLETGIDIDLDVPEDSDMGELPEEMDIQLYYVDGVSYAKIDGWDLLGEDWFKSESDESPIDTESLFEGQIDMLETSDFEIIGSEKINGVDCHVVTLTPTAAELTRLLEAQEEQADMAEQFIGDVDLEDFLDSISIKQWYGKDTFFLMKSQIEVSLDIDSDDVGDAELVEDEFNISMSLHVTMEYDDYNEALNITVPNDARDAPDFMFGF